MSQNANGDPESESKYCPLLTWLVKMIWASRISTVQVYRRHFKWHPVKCSVVSLITTETFRVPASFQVPSTYQNFSRAIIKPHTRFGLRRFRSNDADPLCFRKIAVISRIHKMLSVLRQPDRIFQLAQLLHFVLAQEFDLFLRKILVFHPGSAFS